MPPKKDDSNIFASLDLGKTSRKNELIAKLNDLHKALGELSQDPADRPKELQSICNQLISPKIFENSDKDVKILCCCCMVDAFRVYAPESPFSDSQTVKIFDQIANLLYGIPNIDQNNGTGPKLLYIMQSLATIKSCVIPVILAQSGVRGAEEIVSTMFDALISSIRAEHSDDVVELIEEILHALILESELADQNLLDVLLHPLLPSSKADNPTAYKLVSSVLRKVAPRVQESISSFLNMVLVGSSGMKDSDLSDHIYPLIYELHKVAPDLLLKVIPNICVQLQAEEEEVRMKAVKLLGKLFSSSSADYGKEFNRNFKDYLGRFVDMSMNVRLDMIDNGIAIMHAKPELRKLVEEPLVKRLHDNDHEVRLRTVNVLIEFAMENPMELSVFSFKELGQRIIDRKPEIHKASMIGLSKLYKKFVSSRLPSLNEVLTSTTLSNPGRDITLETASLALLGSVETHLWQRLLFVPGMLVKCWGYPETSHKHQVITLLQEQILPRAGKQETEDGEESEDDGNEEKKNDENDEVDQDDDNLVSINDSRRATALLLAYSTFDINEKQSFEAIMAYKLKVRNELMNFLELIQQHRDAKKSDSSLFSQEHNGNGHNTRNAVDIIDVTLKKSMNKLHGFLPMNYEKKQMNLIDKFSTVKDKNIFKLLYKSLETRYSCTDIFNARDNVAQRLTSKSIISDYVLMMIDFSSSLTCNASMIDQWLKFMNEILQRFQSIGKSDQSSKTSKRRGGANDSLSNEQKELYFMLVQSDVQLLSLSAKYSSTSFTTLFPRVESIFTSLFNTNTMILNSSQIQDSLIDVIDFIAPVHFVEQHRILTSLTANVTFSADFDNIIKCFQTVLDAVASSSVNPDVVVNRADHCAKLTLALSRFMTQQMYYLTSKMSELSQGKKSVVDFEGFLSKLDTLKDSIRSTVDAINTSEHLSINNDRLSCELAMLSSLACIPLRNITTPAAMTNQATDADSEGDQNVNMFKSTLLHSISEIHYVTIRESLLQFIKENMLSIRYFQRNSLESSDIKNELLSCVSYATYLWNNIVATELNVIDNLKSKKANDENVGNHENGEIDNNDVDDGKNTPKKKGKKAQQPSKAKKGSETTSTKNDENNWLTVTNKKTIMKEAEELMEALYACLQSNGEQLVFLEVTSESSKHALIETCALCIVTHLSVPSFTEHFTNTRWKTLAFTAFLPSESSRRRIVETLSIVVQTLAVPMKVYALPCFYANDDSNAIRQRAESLLTFAVKRLRVSYDYACTRLALDADRRTSDAVSSPQSSRRQQVVNECTPEVVLALSLYLLTYHPQFPSSTSLKEESDRKGFDSIVRSIRMVLRVLLRSVATEGENLSYLLKQTTLLAQSYEDREDPSNIGLQYIARIAGKLLLNESVKTAENVQSYPGEVYMPPDLFRRREKDLRSRDNNEDAYLMSQIDALNSADQAMDSALTRAGKGPGRRRVAVITAGGTAAAGVAGSSPVGNRKKGNPRGAAGQIKKVSRKEKEKAMSSEDEQSDSDSEASESHRNSKRKSKGSMTADDEVARKSQRTLPSKVNVSYTEHSEDDEEADEWDRLAGEVKVRTSTGSNSSAMNIGSRKRDSSDNQDKQVERTSFGNKRKLTSNKNDEKAMNKENDDDSDGTDNDSDKREKSNEKEKQVKKSNKDMTMKTNKQLNLNTKETVKNNEKAQISLPKNANRVRGKEGKDNSENEEIAESDNDNNSDNDSDNDKNLKRGKQTATKKQDSKSDSKSKPKSNQTKTKSSSAKEESTKSTDKSGGKSKSNNDSNTTKATTKRNQAETSKGSEEAENSNSAKRSKQMSMSDYLKSKSSKK